jgi:P-type E1-E2 ATPase
MLIYDIPGRGTLYLETLVLDLNGTIALDGVVIPGVGERVERLKTQGLNVYLLTADTRGNGAVIATTLGIDLHRLTAGDEKRSKRAFIEQLGADRTAAIGNGANDAGMLQAAALGIVVLQAEGAATTAWQAADVIVPNILAALDLLLKPKRLIATLRL